MKTMMIPVLAVCLLGGACIVQKRGTQIPVEQEKKSLIGMTYPQLVARYGMPQHVRREAAGPGQPPSMPPGRGGQIADGPGFDTAGPGQAPVYLQYNYTKGYLALLYTWSRGTNYTFVMQNGRVAEVYEHPGDAQQGVTIFGLMPMVQVGSGGPSGGAP